MLGVKLALKRVMKDYSMTKTREELILAAHTAAALVFVRCHRLTDTAQKRARAAACKAILQADRGAGTADHPHAPYSHGVGDLATEGVTLATEGWHKVKAQGGAVGIRRRVNGK